MSLCARVALSPLRALRVSGLSLVFRRPRMRAADEAEGSAPGTCASSLLFHGKKTNGVRTKKKIMSEFEVKVPSGIQPQYVGFIYHACASAASIAFILAPLPGIYLIVFVENCREQPEWSGVVTTVQGGGGGGNLGWGPPPRLFLVRRKNKGTVRIFRRDDCQKHVNAGSSDGRNLNFQTSLPKSQRSQQAVELWVFEFARTQPSANTIHGEHQRTSMVLFYFSLNQTGASSLRPLA